MPHYLGAGIKHWTNLSPQHLHNLKPLGNNGLRECFLLIIPNRCICLYYFCFNYAVLIELLGYGIYCDCFCLM